ncbi:unnamed protein product [Somion occarium]|uniref:Uncharacterized protein n=1 Tax=Somion occarium TaxID=3059160 RepID=A0ABP1CZQ0_9APHY
MASNARNKTAETSTAGGVRRGRSNETTGRKLVTSSIASTNRPSKTVLRDQHAIPSHRTLSSSTVNRTLRPTQSVKPAVPLSKAASRPVRHDVPALSASRAPASTRSDALRIAAEAYSWQYMTATLQHVHKLTERSTLNSLQDRSNELAAEEALVADARVRFEAEQILEFCDELSDSQFSTELPELFQNFLRLASAHRESISSALKLSPDVLDATSIRRCNDCLLTIDNIIQQARHVESQATRLAKLCEGAQSRTHELLKSMLLVVHDQLVTLENARSLVECQKSNTRTRVQLESLLIE